MGNVVAIVVPVSICVILPVLIVWIVFRALINRTNRQTDIVLEAIRNNPGLNTEKLIETMKKREFTPWERLNRKLLRGSIFTLIGITFVFLAAFGVQDSDAEFFCWLLCGVCGSIGIGFLITYFFALRHINEIEAENKK